MTPDTTPQPLSAEEIENIKARRAEKHQPRREKSAEELYKAYENCDDDQLQNYIAAVACEWLDVYEDDVPQFCIIADAIETAGRQQARLLATLDERDRDRELRPASSRAFARSHGGKR